MMLMSSSGTAERIPNIPHFISSPQSTLTSSRADVAGSGEFHPRFQPGRHSSCHSGPQRILPPDHLRRRSHRKRRVVAHKRRGFPTMGRICFHHLKCERVGALVVGGLRSGNLGAVDPSPPKDFVKLSDLCFGYHTLSTSCFDTIFGGW